MVPTTRILSTMIFILANPPFNVSDWGGDRLQDDIRWKYGVPPVSNANYAWLEHMLHHLNPVGGVVGTVLANGSLSSLASVESEIRKNMILDDVVECIVSLPSQLFYTTGIPVSLWILRKGKTVNAKGHVLFIDARKFGHMVDRKIRELSQDDIEKIAGTYHAWRNGTAFEEIKGFCKAASIEEIGKEGYILAPGRYVGIAEQDDDGEPITEKILRLKEELNELFFESENAAIDVQTMLNEFDDRFSEEEL